MNEKTSDYDYFINKRTDRVYLSKSLDAKFPIKNEKGEIED